MWMSPIFKSPMADMGYDISDYRTVDPLYGTNDDLKSLLETLKKIGQIRLCKDRFRQVTSVWVALFMYFCRVVPNLYGHNSIREVFCRDQDASGQQNQFVVSIFISLSTDLIWPQVGQRQIWFIYYYLQVNLNYISHQYMIISLCLFNDKNNG